MTAPAQNRSSTLVAAAARAEALRRRAAGRAGMSMGMDDDARVFRAALHRGAKEWQAGARSGEPVFVTDADAVRVVQNERTALRAGEIAARLHAKALEALRREGADSESIVAAGGALNRAAQVAYDALEEHEPRPHSGENFLHRLTPLGGADIFERSSARPQGVNTFHPPAMPSEQTGANHLWQ